MDRPKTGTSQINGGGKAICPPIRDYAVIGDCHGAALVGRRGAIDWCCLERFDADPVFCRLIGGEGAGYFEIRPVGDFHSGRRYLPGTNILESTFHTSEGVAVVTDFMPMGRNAKTVSTDPHAIKAPRWLVRILECRQGKLKVTIRYSLCGPDFNAMPQMLTREASGVSAAGGQQLYSDIDFVLGGNIAEAFIELHAGQRLSFVLTPGKVENVHPTEHADTLLEVTRAYWKEWLGTSNYEGPYREVLERSALILKLLTYAPSGAIVAAPTTSLPETIGGERNWDYRYCWLRDATFTLYALAALGYEGEAGRFSAFLSRCLQETSPEVRILYGIECETELAEQTLDHLPGYCNSRPVRKGNAAYRQCQLDVYGEVLDWALLYQTLGGKISDEEASLLKKMADQVAADWDKPDQGIWEMRGEPRHHVYSKMMCWVALDRALRLFGDNARWDNTREAVRTAIHERGIDPVRGYLKQSFEHAGMDAAVLMAPIVGFPLKAETLTHTIDALSGTLYGEGYLHRYTPGVDGLAGEEGAFLACSFWLVDALLFLERREEAEALFEMLLSKANDVGLLSEEIDPSNGKLLGNFPQAWTHLAVIRSAFIMELHEKGGSEMIAGAHADRAQKHTEVSSQPEALWVAFKQKVQPVYEPWSDASLLRSFWEDDGST